MNTVTNPSRSKAPDGALLHGFHFDGMNHGRISRKKPIPTVMERFTCFMLPTIVTVRIESTQPPGLRSELSCSTQPVAPAGQEKVTTPGEESVPTNAGWAMKLATRMRLDSDVKL